MRTRASALDAKLRANTYHEVRWVAQIKRAKARLVDWRACVSKLRYVARQSANCLEEEEEVWRERSREAGVCLDAMLACAEGCMDGARS